jgi:Flp pilus assembly protein TadD
MKYALYASFAAALLAVLPPALGADIETTPVQNAADDDYAAGKRAVGLKNWAEAAARFGKVVAKDPNNADAYTMLGYALRWEGKLEQAFAAYDRALTLDPNHRGAHQYLGVAYLKAGQPDQAEAQLAILERIAGRNAAEYKELAEAIAKSRPAKN